MRSSNGERACFHVALTNHNHGTSPPVPPTVPAHHTSNNVAAGTCYRLHVQRCLQATYEIPTPPIQGLFNRHPPQCTMPSAAEALKHTLTACTLCSRRVLAKCASVVTLCRASISANGKSDAGVQLNAEHRLFCDCAPSGWSSGCLRGQCLMDSVASRPPGQGAPTQTQPTHQARCM